MRWPATLALALLAVSAGCCGAGGDAAELPAGERAPVEAETAPAKAESVPAEAESAPAEPNPSATAPAEMLSVRRWRPRVIARHDHDRSAFTQGLLWHDGALYESTGQYGTSTLRRWRPAADGGGGRMERMLELDRRYFAEGLARVGDRLIQLTYREGVALIYDLESFARRGQHRYEGEGWGLCHDGERLVMSDGSATLTLRDPESFEVVGSVAVTRQGKPLGYLNELECVDGTVWANVWLSELIVGIDPATGRVTDEIDAAELLPPDIQPGVDVLNGIAHRPDTGSWYLTGKNWPVLYEVELVEN